MAKRVQKTVVGERSVRSLLDPVHLGSPHLGIHYKQVVTDTLRPLEPDQRDAFLLTQILGLRYEEAARLLGCPIGTVRSRVARGRIRLLDQEHLDEEGLA